MSPGETIRIADPASELHFACSATKETGAQQHFGLDYSLRVRPCARRQRTGRRRRRSLRWAAGPRCCRSQWPSAASSMSRIISLSRAVLTIGWAPDSGWPYWRAANDSERPNCDIHDVGMGAQEWSPIHLASVGHGLLRPSDPDVARRLLRRYLSSIDTQT